MSEDPEVAKAREEARALADEFERISDGQSPVLIATACCMLIHRLDPAGAHLPAFAQDLLESSAWMRPPHDA